MDATDTFFELNQRHLDKRIGGFPEGKRLTGWVVLGQTIMHREKRARAVLNYHYYKPRFHLMVVRASGTAKTELLRAQLELARGLRLPGFTTCEVTEATSKSLVGGIQRTMDYKTGKVLTEQADYGSFSNSIALLPEAQTFIESTSLWGKTAGMLLNALDNYGKVVSTSFSDIWKTGEHQGEKFSYVAKTSVLSSSTFRQSMRREVINSGLLQRFLLDFKDFTKKDFQENRKRKREIIQASAVSTNEFLEGKTSVAEIKYEHINELREFVYKTPISPFVSFDIHGLNKFDKYEEDMINQYESDFPEMDETTNTFETFSNRLEIYTRLMASAKTMFDNRKKITYDDLMFALNDTKYCYKGVVDFINSTTLQSDTRREEKTNELVINAIDRPPYLYSRDDLRVVLKNLKAIGKLRISNADAERTVKSLVDSGVIIEYGGLRYNKKYYCLSKNASLVERNNMLKKLGGEKHGRN